MGKKILLVSEYFTPHFTGIAQAFDALAQQLSSQKNSVTILTTQFDKTLPLSQQYSNLTIYRSPYLFKISRTHYSLTIIFDFLKIIRNQDVVVINSPNSNIFFFSILAKLFNKKLIIFHQGDLILQKGNKNFFINIIIEKLFDILTIPSLFLADTVSTYTRDYAENSRVLKYFLHKFKAYIPTLPVPTKKADSSFLKKIDNLKKNHILIGFAGRFVEEKGFDILFKSIPFVLKTYPNALLVFAGETNISYENSFQINKKLIDKYKKQIILLGLLNKSELFLFYKSLDVFVISSRSDCFPLTQMEVAICGIPLVVTDIPGARMLVKETGFGEVVLPENPQSLANGIISVLQTRESLIKRKNNVIQFLSNYETFPL